MKLSELKSTLRRNPDQTVRLILPDGDVIPAHFHVTEVGYVTKRFIDCGGTTRELATVQLQIWLGTDEAHRLTAGKLADILDLGRKVVPGEALEVELEYEDCSISQYLVETISVVDGVVQVMLGSKHTDCLAKETCGVEPSGASSSSCCGGTGCSS
ncbi:MAG: DUF6428 family protein [Opitutaceae bacterium]